MTALARALWWGALPAVDPLAYFSAEEIAAWRVYRTPHYVEAYVDPIVSLVILGWLVFFRGAPAIKARCDRLAARLWPAARQGPVLRLLDRVWKDRSWAGAILFAVAFLAILLAVFLPKDAYFALVYERRHGVSKYTLGTFLKDVAVTQAAGLALMCLMVLSVYGVMRRLRHWWLAVGAPAAVLSLYGGFLDPYKEMLVSTYAPLAAGPTRDAVESVLERAGVEHEGVLVVDSGRTTTAANAYFMGEGPSRRVVLSDNLLEAMAPAEIAVAVAHEVGHLSEPRWASAAGGAVAILALFFLSDRALRALARRPRFGLRGPDDPAGLPVMFFLLGVAALAAMPVNSAYSRFRERSADAYALELTRDPDAFISLFVKLARRNQADVDPPPYIRWRRKHPTVLERLAVGQAARSSAPTRDPGSPGSTSPSR